MPTKSGGHPGAAALLTDALAAAARAPATELTHGFHSWPARMHPAIARTLLGSLKGRVVLDPFVGGGTVLVEARVAGWRSVGVDLSPLAVRLADVRSEVRPAPARARFLEVAEAVAAASEARVRGRTPIRVDLPEEETQWYDVHVLKELGGLREEIRAAERLEDRRALAMVFSSILIKVSRQRADTAERTFERRIRKGLSTEIFLRKAHELAERWAELAAVSRGPRPEIIEGDARRLPERLEGAAFDLVLTSPPYGGTYDYALHHARRMAWLRLDDRALHRFEVGARRHSQGPGARSRWDAELSEVLGSIARVLAPGGHVALVIGDGELEGRRVSALHQVMRLAPPVGLELVASASAPRLDHRGGRSREEHLILLTSS